MGRKITKTSQWSVAGNDWDILDFGDIEKELAAKLTDDDIKKVLLHIDAAHKVKRLRLTNCVNIAGNGLSPLTNSASIEQIDLSLVKPHKNPELDPVPALSRYSVLPILESIIRLERKSLKHVQFPHVWRLGTTADGEDELVEDPQMHSFIEQYNELMTNRSTGLCELCNGRLEPEHNCLGDYYGSMFYGIQSDTCSVCVLKYSHCFYCRGLHPSIDHCFKCERYYCDECAPVKVECGACQEYFCSSCIGSVPCADPDCRVIVCDDCRSSDRSCRECLKTWCYDCDVCFRCKYCSKQCCWACSKNCDLCFEEKCCRTCATSEDISEVLSCDDCNKTYCNKCRMLVFQEGDSNCKKCLRMISSLLLEKTKTQGTEIEGLRAENQSLRNQICRMKSSMAAINRLSQT